MTTPSPPPQLSSPGPLVWPALDEQVRAMQPDLARVCLYHLGLDTGGNGTSKLLRASLMLASAEGLGVSPHEMRTEAAAVELLHNSTLLHDDIIDDDRIRRGRPSVWAAFGVPLAVLAGDAMQAAGLRMVLDTSDRQARLFADAIGLVLAGQADELALDMSAAASTARFEQVAARKTSSLLECSLAAPGVVISAPQATLTALRGAGHHLGIAWQAANDIENIWGDTEVTGKPERGDLKRRNPTLPVLIAAADEGPVGGQLRQLWQRPGNTAAHLDEIAELIDQAGGYREAHQLSRRHLGLALDCLSRAGLSADSVDQLSSLFRFIVTRKKGSNP